jgi:hypothetical protein
MARERLTMDLVEDMVRTLRASPDTHIVLTASLLPVSGHPRVRTGGGHPFLHRHLWERVTGEKPGRIVGACTVDGCYNPFHWRVRAYRYKPDRKPRQHAFCRQGHRLTKANRYEWIDREGRSRSRCRTCQLQRQRDYRERKKS